MFIYYAQHPSISRLGRYFGSTEYAPTLVSNTPSNSTTDGRVVFISKALVVRFESPLFFANCRTLSKMLQEELEHRICAENVVESGSSTGGGQLGEQANENHGNNNSSGKKKKQQNKGARKNTKWKACVIDFGSVGWMDVTAADILKIPIQLYGKHGYPVYLARCNQMSARMLDGAGVVELLELHGGGLELSVHDAVKKVLLLKKKKKKIN